MTMLSKRDDGRRSGRADSRRSKRNRLFWMGTSESPRLEPRTMPALTVTTFQIPLVALVEPQGITTGSDGNLWFTENGAGKIGRMTPAGAVTSFALPQVPPPAGSAAGTASTTPHPTAITAGPDGALWFTGIPGEIGRITTAGVVTEFALPAVPPPAGSKPGTAGTLATASAIVAGPDGALWFTGVPGEIGRISTTGVVTEFAVPEIPPPAGSKPGTPGTAATPTSITVGPDGALWFGENGAIGRIATAGTIEQFPLANSSGTVDDITAGPDGALWFTEQFPTELNSLARITTSGAITEYPGLVPNNVGSMIEGPDGNLWLTEAPPAVGFGNGPYVTICRITPAGTFTAFNVPGNFDTIGGLTPGPGGNLWFTEAEDGSTAGEQPAIGEITPAGVTALHPIPQGTTLDPNLGVPLNAQAIATGADGTVSFTENDAIGRISSQGTIQQFPLVTPGATPEMITSGPNDGMWFAQQVFDNSGDETWSVGLITAGGAITVYPLSPEASVSGITEGRNDSLWVAESLTDPNTGADTLALGRITRQGVVTTFAVPLGKTGPDRSYSGDLGAITTGPDGDVWFTGDYPSNDGSSQSFIGRITARGHVRLFPLPRSLSSSSSSYGVFDPVDVSSVASGPGSNLSFAATITHDTPGVADNAHDTPGVAEISTDGKLGRFVPAAIYGNLVAGSMGEIWFPGNGFAQSGQLALITRSGIVVTYDLPAQDYEYGGIAGVALGTGGELWLTTGTSTIERVNGLDSPAGGLDYRHRPKRAPDYLSSPYDGTNGWTNVTGSTHPTFAGVAKPGAEVTLWAQKQGQNEPVSIGQVKASKFDGSWTLKSHVKLSNGYYAVTATQSGGTGPPSVLYSLTPDSSGNLSNALVIQTRHAGK
jgi:streptogramin lyase